MAKPESSLLVPARFPFRTEQEIRFSYMDINRHVNNVSIAGFVEEGRVRFHTVNGFHGSLKGLGAMAVRVAIDYVGQAFYPGVITVYAGASRIGSSSYDLELLLCQDERRVAHACSTMVCTREGRPFALPDSFREAVKHWMVKP